MDNTTRTIILIVLISISAFSTGHWFGKQNDNTIEIEELKEDIVGLRFWIEHEEGCRIQTWEYLNVYTDRDSGQTKWSLRPKSEQK